MSENNPQFFDNLDAFYDQAPGVWDKIVEFYLDAFSGTDEETISDKFSDAIRLLDVGADQREYLVTLEFINNDFTFYQMFYVSADSEIKITQITSGIESLGE